MSRPRHNRDSDFLVSPGARNRSVFELSESGASKALLDSVQFNLDGLFTLKSSKPRMLCAFKLIEMCTSSKQVLIAFRSNGIAATLLRVVGLLASESDHSFRLCLQALALILCQSDKGEILSGIDIPRNVFMSLLISVQQQQPYLMPSSSCSAPDNESASQSSTVEDSTAKSSSIHRKRKFSGKKGVQTTSIGNATENDALLKKRILTKQTNDESEMEDSASVFPNNDGIQELIKNLQAIWPSFSAFCGFEYLLCDRNVSGIGQLLALTLVSRYLISLVQHDTQSQGHSTALKDNDNDTDSLKDENENEYDSNLNDKKTSKVKNKETERNDAELLGEYQNLLRISLPEQIKNIPNNNTYSALENNVPKNVPAYAECFLSITISEIGKEILSVLEVLEQVKNIPKNVPRNIENNTEGSLQSLGISRINRIYQVLCLLDASCFRCSENQVRTVHLSVLSICMYFTYICTISVSTVSACTISVCTVCTVHLYVLYICMYCTSVCTVSVRTVYLDVLYICI
jgi:Wings apart-like protein regulation of heterochromatin